MARRRAEQVQRFIATRRGSPGRGSRRANRNLGENQEARRRLSLPRPAVAGGERTPAELVAEGAVEAVARESDHREWSLAAANGHTVAGLEGNLDLAVN